MSQKESNAEQVKKYLCLFDKTQITKMHRQKRKKNKNAWEVVDSTESKFALLNLVCDISHSLYQKQRIQKNFQSF